MQNRLEDIFSLTEFLRFYPVDNPLNTRQHILAPLGRKDHKILKDLQIIMSSIALRRSKMTCESRSRVERVEVVVLSPEEREQYKMFLLEAKEKRTRRGRDTRAQVLLRAILNYVNYAVMARRIQKRWSRAPKTSPIVPNVAILYL